MLYIRPYWSRAASAALRAARRLVPGLLLLAPLSASLAQERPDPMAGGLTMRERLNALVERVKLEQSALATMEADFVQHKVSILLVEPESSRGVFSYRAPESVRWEYETPKPIIIVIQGDDLLTWYRDIGTAEHLKVGRYADQVFKYMGASGSLETLMEYFELSVQFPGGRGEPYQVDLVPRYARIEKRIKAMQLWIDGETFLPIRLKYVEPNGDHTEYWFENMRINGEIPNDRFKVQLPADVEVREVEIGS